MFRTPVSFFIKLRQLLDVTLDAVYHYRLLWTDHNDFPGGFHPVHLLRNLPDKARAWTDLCLAMAAIEAGPAALPEGEGSGL